MNVHCSAVMNRHDNGRHNVICVIARKTDDDDDDSDVMVLVWRSPWMTRNMKRIVKKERGVVCFDTEQLRTIL